MTNDTRKECDHVNEICVDYFHTRLHSLIPDDFTSEECIKTLAFITEIRLEKAIQETLKKTIQETIDKHVTTIERIYNE